MRKTRLGRSVLLALAVFSATYLYLNTESHAIEEDLLWRCGTDSTTMAGSRNCPGTIPSNIPRKALVIFIKFADDTTDWYAP